MARDDDTVVWFDEKELDPPGDSVDFEVSDDQLDREIDAMFAGVVEGAAGAVTGDGFRAAVADRMPGAGGCDRIATGLVPVTDNAVAKPPRLMFVKVKTAISGPPACGVITAL